MGQANSSPSSPSAEPGRRGNRNSLLLRSTSQRPQRELDPARQPLTRARPLSAMPVSRPFSELQGDSSATSTPNAAIPTRSRLGRARTAITSIPDLFRRPSTLNRSTQHRGTFRLRAHHTNIQYPPSAMNGSQVPAWLPDVDVSDLDLNFDPTPAQPVDSTPRLLPTRRDSPRPSSMFSDRISALRPDRGLRSVTNPLRRRRSPLRRAGEDQAAMLSRLLSVAAAATAASLMGGNPRAVSEARSTGLDGEDGTFDGFLQALQNGRIASALRQGSGNDSEAAPEGTNGGHTTPVNFFRMFRFGSSPTNNNAAGGRGENMSHARTGSNSGQSGNGDRSNEGSDGRMVPIIIVGIRSITPGSGNGGEDGHMIPPFLDALSNFPTTLSTGQSASIDGVLRPPQNETRFSQRRRASMGGINAFPSGYDAQRHHRSLENTRPWSTISETPSGPRPPPTTPASPGLSAVSSGTTTPTHPTPANTSAASTAPHSRVPSRRESLISRPPPSSMNLISMAEDSSSSTAVAPNNTFTGAPRSSPRQRRLSESDFTTRFGSGSSRRNGVVEPLEAAHPPSSPFSRSTNTDASASTSTDASPPYTSSARNGSGNESREGNNDSGSRSWIIYVLGGSYPENHPILTTPSLFTENPTYEDMLLLSALLGPAKPPVASTTDVESAGGLYRIEIRDTETTATEKTENSIVEGEEGQMQKLMDEQVRREQEAAELTPPAPKLANAWKDADGDVYMLDLPHENNIKKQKTAAVGVGQNTDSTQPPEISKVEVPSRTGVLVAVADDGSDVIDLSLEQRCLVCLSDFESKETARKLVKCGHLFHRECIDQWLTTGRNSCPLCRGQGVDEKSTDTISGTENSPTTSEVSSSGPSSSNSSSETENPDSATMSSAGEVDVEMEDVVE